LRETLFLRSGGVCERDGCDTPITLETMQVAHLRSHAHGGPLTIENTAAWCAPCNHTQGWRDAADTRLLPRQWQLDALDRIVARIARDGVATVSAAPGAGKTIFAGLVFEALYEADLVDRMVVLAPRLTLVDQWVGALLGARHLQLRPGHEVERDGQDGVVVTYQSLNADTLAVHRRMAAHQRTLLVPDEVHHVGEHERSAWARNVRELAGVVDVDLHVAGVLNLSGTLWRSRTDERISTVRYRAAGENKIEALVDHDEPTAKLILDGQLRPVDLHTIDGRVELFETANFQMVASDMIDLDEPAARAVIRELAGQQPWLEAFVAKILGQLQQAHDLLEGHPVKALIVAARQEDAYIYRDEVNRQMRALGLTPFAEVAVSDEPDAAATLRRFRGSPNAGVLCTVDMAGEGYDCPDIAVIGYASNKLTPLYIRQVIARAMRVTETERRLGQVIPAVVVAPNVEPLLGTLKAHLGPFSHEIMLEAQRDLRATGEGEGQLRLHEQPYIIDSVVPGQQFVTVPLPEGEGITFTEQQLAAMGDLFRRFNVPAIWHARFVAAMQDWMREQQRSNPFDPRFADTDAAGSAPVGRREPSIEELAEIRTGQIRRLERWFAVNGDTPIQLWVARANKTAGIPTGKRAEATVEQLERLLTIERDLIAAYCRESGTTPPRGSFTREAGGADA